MSYRTIRLQREQRGEPKAIEYVGPKKILKDSRTDSSIRKLIFSAGALAGRGEAGVRRRAGPAVLRDVLVASTKCPTYSMASIQMVTMPTSSGSQGHLTEVEL
ncbi:hypothetical protein AC579_1268 [Pseudocercospora musae]|uniref:Uncharacterized protein n=1 Tax=Pseudocercospora musae TaxID=113226 RepID=A0A139IHZ5_9PEZI|nr:hypothetical protein AC579_1268 [Pseudocercospora musae]